VRGGASLSSEVEASASHLYADQRLLQIASTKKNYQHGGSCMHIAKPAVQPPHLKFIDNASRVTRDDEVDPIRVRHRRAAWWRGECASCEQHAASQKALQLTRVNHCVREMRKRRWWPAQAQLDEVDQSAGKLFGEKKKVQVGGEQNAFMAVAAHMGAQVVIEVTALDTEQETMRWCCGHLQMAAR
jgi:hypothetical protein